MGDYGSCSEIRTGRNLPPSRVRYCWWALELGFGARRGTSRSIVAGFAVVALAAGLVTVFSGGGDISYRRRAVVGLLLALSGVIGVWGIGFFSLTWFRSVLEKQLKLENMDETHPGNVDLLDRITSMMQNLGAFFGIYAFGLVAQRFGRKPELSPRPGCHDCHRVCVRILS